MCINTKIKLPVQHTAKTERATCCSQWLVLLREEIQIPKTVVYCALFP